MNSLKTLFLIFAIICASVMARDLKSTKSPTNKSSKGPKVSKKTKSPSHAKKGSKLSNKARFVSIGLVDFEDLGSSSTNTVPVGSPYRGLTWSNWEWTTYQTFSGFTNIAYPTSTTVSFEIASGVFSMISVDIREMSALGTVNINGYDSSGTLLHFKTITFSGFSFQTFDLSAFALIAKLEFVFVPSTSGFAVDDIVFL
jgi:hypothetical protein